MDIFETYSTTFPVRSIRSNQSRRKSSVIPGISTLHSAIYSTSSTLVQDSLISFVSYVKTQDIPILPVTKPDIRTVLGQGASFLVNGCEVPRTYVDPVTGSVFPQGMVVAFKRAILNQEMSDPIADRIRTIFNELLTMHHPPLRAHPNIVKLHGVGFETEGPADSQNAMPVLIVECAELGNLAEVLETARKEDRALSFDEKISLCIDIAHGLEILHACDIVHGDVKCENVLIFEKENEASKQKFNLYCKLTDFGVLRHPTGGVILGGSRPWQAPECSRGAYFRLEAAKRTDVYSFGMLLWRVMLDGDPFKLLGDFEGQTAKDKRLKRNEAVAKLKEGDRLVQHVCESLALSDKFTRPQLEMLCEVMNVTLVEDSTRRELDMARIIRLLTPNNWYESRHVLPPERLPMEVETQLLDIEKWYSEFELASPVVQKWLVQGYRDSAEEFPGQDDGQHDEKRSAAAYQLAICYANGFGVPFDSNECLKWLRFAAEKGSQKAQEALPKVALAFDAQAKDYVNISLKDDDSYSLLSTSVVSDEGGYLEIPDRTQHAETKHSSHANVSSSAIPTLLNAAESCNYGLLDALLQNSAAPSTSEDGVSPIHFLSSWDVSKAEELGKRLVDAGADVNARAKRGPSVGGTPLMWSVYGDHLEHSRILIKLGADPMASMEDDADALSFAAKLHSTDHLRLLLENVRPARVHNHLRRLIEAAAGGESRFTRLVRHGDRWKTAADETLDLLRRWNALFPDADDFRTLLLPALHSSLQSSYGRMNTDVQVCFIETNTISPTQMTNLLWESVVGFNQELFNALLDYNVPVTPLFEHKKSLLHLCAKIPDHNLAATAFAPRLIALGAEVDQRDEDDITPWMDAILERKWDLADLLMASGANPLAVNKAGFNVLGLCIKAINLGSIKYLLKYCAERQKFHHDSFLVNTKQQISAVQLSATLPLPRSHGMKLEVMGVFLTILANFAKTPDQLNFRSDAFLPNATALEIAASRGNLHPVKNLVKRGAHLASGPRAIDLAKTSLHRLNTTATGPMTVDPMHAKNLERCIYVIQHWDDDDGDRTKRLADDWTNMRTIDESHVKSSWEIVVFDYKSRISLVKRER